MSEELKLPPLPLPQARFYTQGRYRRASVLPGKGDPLFDTASMQAFARQAVEADRASRPAVSPQSPDVDDVRDAWISVDDELPPEDEDVLILYWPYDDKTNKQRVGQSHLYDGCFWSGSGDPHHYPSHWMKMPLVPGIAAAMSRIAKEGESDAG